MAWDKSLPANQTKIRNYPSVLTGNFAAVEEGQDSLKQWKINLIERNAIPSAPATDPTRVDDVMQLYSKQNADGNTDLYVLDDRNPANVIELTENGKVGGRSQDFVMQNFYFEDNATSYNQGNIVKASGSFDSSGNLTGGSNMSTSASPNPLTGTYNVDVDADVLENGTNYRVVVTPFVNGSQVIAGVALKPNAATGVATTIQIKISSVSSANVNAAFDVMVVGGV